MELFDEDGYFILDSDEKLEAAILDWLSSRPREVYLWTAVHGWNMTDAYLWWAAGFSPDDALAWSNGLPNTPFDLTYVQLPTAWAGEQGRASIAQKCVEQGFEPGEHFPDIPWGWDPAELRRWLDAGFDLDSAREWRLRLGNDASPAAALQLIQASEPVGECGADLSCTGMTEVADASRPPFD